MGAFINTLHATKIAEADSNGRARWKLTAELHFQSSQVGDVIVPAGFTTDFASVPRLPLAYLVAGDTAHASAVIHDWLVRSKMPHSMTWRTAADVFLEAMKAEGVPAWRRFLMYWAVRLVDPGEP